MLYHPLIQTSWLTFLLTRLAPTNTKFKQLLLPTQAGMPYTNTHKHRTSYFKSTLTFLGPAKRWKSICAARQKPEILAVLHHNIIFFSNISSDEIPLRSTCKCLQIFFQSVAIHLKYQGSIQDFLLGGGSHIFEEILDIFGQQNRRIQL